MRPTLIIGNRNYSSWSLRPWLVLRWAGLSFDTELVQIEDGYPAGEIPALAAVSPTGKVPVLRLGEEHVWESLAICEWANERAPEAQLWPADPTTRAVCRAVASEMHGGFGALRRDLPVNIRRRTSGRTFAEDTRADIARVQALFGELLARHGGPFLFGERSIADAMFAPVCTRFRTYGVELSEASARYLDAVLTDRDFLEWEREAEAEPWTIPSSDAK